MTKFDFSDGQLSIIDAHGHSVVLSPQEVVELLRLLSEKRTMLLDLSSQRNAPQEELAIHLLEQQMVHLDELKAAIPQLKKAPPTTGDYVAPAESVTERAIQLLEEFQIEYKIHPLLEEEDSAFAQG